MNTITGRSAPRRASGVHTFKVRQSSLPVGVLVASPLVAGCMQT